MKLLATKTNVAAPSVAYPFGNIRNKTLSVAGTPVDVEVYGDFHQFFEKMFDASGITANGLPDNVTNGWQLYEALIKVTQPDWTSAGITFSTVGANTWANLASSGLFSIAYKVKTNEVSLCGAASISSVAVPGDIPIMTLPVAARPTSIARPLARVLRGSTVTIEQITINTTGIVTVANGSGTFTPQTVWFEGISYRKS